MVNLGGNMPGESETDIQFLAENRVDTIFCAGLDY